jgi:hypothetical protein
MKRCVIAVMAWLIGSCAAWNQVLVGADAPPRELQLKYRWVFTMTNLASEDALQKTLALIERAKRARYNGILLTDSKFAKFQLQQKHYAVNVRRLRDACTQQGMTLAVGVCPMGYAAELLAADPNLAEGMPVRDALFEVRGGRLLPVDETLQLVNGSLDQWKGDVPVGWSVDRPGTVSFRDEQFTYNGRLSVRQDHTAAGRAKPVRMIQKIRVQPWRYYHISVMARTEDCTSKDFRVFAVAGDPAKGYPLNWQPPEIKPTMDWTRLHATFCSLDNTEVGLYVGSYNVRGGTIWWSDVQVEPGGWVNVIRRPSLPLTVTSLDGQTTYTEGQDFSEVRDLKLGHDPNPGYFTYWHEPPTVTIPAGSRIQDGQRVRANYHVATLVGKSHQINCCFSEPKVYDLLEKQIQWVHEVVQPDVFMLSHDEIRHCGWDDTCAKRNLTCGQILADNVKRCVEIVQRHAPRKPIVTWNDMFDPYHNARQEGWFYLAKGFGPFHGSWEGLSADVTIVNWLHNNADSLQFFAGRGHAQILAGYYDADPKRIVDWLQTAKPVKGVCGVMYTTWVNDYSQLEAFLKYAQEFAGQRD